MELEIIKEGAEWDLPWAYLIVLKILLEPMTFIPEMSHVYCDMAASVVPTGSMLLCGVDGN